MAYQFKYALRSVLKHKVNTLISVMGLAVGMTVSILILSFVRFEVGFDQMHHGSDRIYRLNWEVSGSRFATFFNGVTPIYAEIFPQIDSFTRLAPRSHLLSIDGVNQYATVTMVDNDFFRLFNYDSVTGNADEAIHDLNSAVITEAAAEQIFSLSNASDAVGRVFTLDQSFDYRVAAVVANNPGNSHLGSNIFVNIENLPEVWNNSSIFDNLGSDVFYHYLRVAPGTDVQQFEDELERAYSEEINPGFDVQVYLQPLSAIHFTSDLQNEMSMRDDVLGIVKPIRQRSDILVFSAVAALTLLIATVNFMNLQLVQFTRRARELGVKRVMGSSKLALTGQLLIETIIIAFFALVASLILCQVFMPFFNSMVAASMESVAIFSVETLLQLMSMAVLVGILAGLYPAVTLARLSPVHALKGELVKGVSSNRFRAALIVTQFSISIGLIVAAGIVNSQINYALSSGLGFDPTNVVTVELSNRDARNAYDTMRSELAGEPGVVAISVANIIPGRDLSNGTGFSQVNGAEQTFGVRSVVVGDDYFETLGMEVLAGRALDDDFPTDFLGGFSDVNVDRRGAMVLNETAARQAGFSDPADAVGAEIYGGGEFRGVLYTTNATVVGVVADAQFGSIRADVPAIGFTMEESRSVMLIKIAAENQVATLNAIDRIWNSNVIEMPIQREFLSDSYQVFYAGEQRTFALFATMSVLAVLIACVGLYAVTAYIAERRSKEMSIRKVLGASVRNLVTLLSWDLSRLVLIANVIAWPLSWYAMQQWLANFAFQTDVGVGIFLIAGVATFLLALATTFQRAYGVATRNPVNALRSE